MFHEVSSKYLFTVFAFKKSDREHIEQLTEQM